jgi:metal-responsive CopG/Arc/MetJ family transcriptional regulator
MSELYRAQILLDKKQHQRLAQIAAAEERSLSELVREIVAEYLVERGRTDRRQRELAALAALERIRQTIPASPQFEQLLHAAREERAGELPAAWPERP